MTRDEFKQFIDSIKAIVPFEATNSIAHAVLEDYNFSDSDIKFQLKWIDDKGYEDILSEYQFDVDPTQYVAFIRGALQLMLSIPETIRDGFHDDDDDDDDDDEMV